MKSHQRLIRLIAAPLALLLSCVLASGQLNEKEKAEQEQKRRAEVERKTYALIDDIATSALGLKLPENRLFVLTAAADLLWEHDQPRAKNLFWDALNIINLMNSSVGQKRSQTDGEAKKLTAKEKEERLREYYTVFGSRRELLQRVARHDPQLALEMLRSSRQVSVESTGNFFPVADDRELEQQIASEAAARDPQRAYQLARESLAKGLSAQLFEVLFRLNQRDQELGTKFSADVIEKLRGRSLSNDLYGSMIVFSMLTYSRALKTELKPQSLRPLLLNESQRRELVELITNAVLEPSPNATLMYQVDEIKPEIEEFVPERLALIERKLAAFNQTLNKEQRASQEFNSRMRNGTPEDLLKLAVRSDENERDWMQEQAILSAIASGRADSMREYIKSEIDDAGRRKELLDLLDQNQIEYAAYKGDVEGLRKLLPQIRRREERARAMAELAIALEKKNEHDEALKLLDEAQTMIKEDLTSETQTNALLALMSAYAVVEPGRAFGIAERTIDRANDDLAKFLLLDKIIKSGVLKKGELKLTQSGLIPFDFALFKYGKGVAALAQVDFDRTKAAADRFQRYELRLMARLLLAQALLRPSEPATSN